MHLVEIVLLSLAGVGHFCWAVNCVNRVHALAIPRWSISALSYLFWSSLILIPLLLARAPGNTLLDLVQAGNYVPLAYLVPCWLALVREVIVRVRGRLAAGASHAGLVEDRHRSVDVARSLGYRPVGDGATAFFAALPGNELLRISIHRKTLRVPRLAPQLEGVSIAHLSDLHMCGKITRAYFEEVVELTNAERPDLVAITGDLFDSNDCLAWIPSTLARLRAPHGVYFIFGNHDRRVDHERARRLLVEAGLVDLGGRCREVLIRGARVLLAGNELPWFAPAADLRDSGHDGESRRTRILLSHSPDQLEWARLEDIDLMLAGHTHGGQIRLPLIGPVLSASKQGTQYTAGTFYVTPTVLHVSRGISSLSPLRWNCPQELAVLRLQTGVVAEAAPDAAELLELGLSQPSAVS